MPKGTDSPDVAVSSCDYDPLFAVCDEPRRRRSAHLPPRCGFRGARPDRKASQAQHRSHSAASGAVKLTRRALDHLNHSNCETACYRCLKGSLHWNVVELRATDLARGAALVQELKNR